MCTYLHNFLYCFQVFHGTEKEAAYWLFLPEIMELVAQIEIQPIKICVCPSDHSLHTYSCRPTDILSEPARQTDGRNFLGVYRA